MNGRLNSKKALSYIIISLLFFSLLSPGLVMAMEDSKEKEIQGNFLNQYDEEDNVSFLIKFKEKADTELVTEEIANRLSTVDSNVQDVEVEQRAAVIDELKDTSHQSQKVVLEFLDEEMDKEKVEEINPYYIVNGIAVTATKEVAEKVMKFKEVEEILPNETHYLHEANIENSNAVAQKAIEWNVERVGAPDVWADGIDGTGVVVATIDSGVDWDHPALKEKYRGFDSASGKVNHDYNWFDAVSKKSSSPYDPIGHGTHVTGTIVGGEPDGKNQIGVAPGAEWIAVKAFDDYGTATDSDLLKAAEWILAPTDREGNERPGLAPDIVNNSWGSGMGFDEWYRDVVQAWVDAGIFPVFSAGNSSWSNTGGPGSVENPANYPESFAIGATDKENQHADFSLLGPSPYNEIKPDISAPGVSIRSASPGGTYEEMSGTSMATPAASGVIALLYQAGQNLSVNQIKDIVRETAIPLQDETFTGYPNNGYGYGLINAPQAVHKALEIEAEKVSRIFGHSRYETAIEISQNGWNYAETVILARGDDFADALAGVPLAYQLDSPILLTHNNDLYEKTLEEIKRLRASQVVILGGPVAISDGVVKELRENGLDVKRISGHSRIETASRIALDISPKSDKVIIANGYNFPDALSVAPYAAQAGIPILLTMNNSLPDSTIQAVKTLRPSQTIVIGGSLVVGNSIMEKLPNPTRISGSDRYGTNIETTKYFGHDSNKFYVATGRNYADTLTGAVLAAKNNSSILLVHEIVPETTTSYLNKREINKAIIFGGPAAVNDKVEKDVENLIAQ